MATVMVTVMAMVMVTVMATVTVTVMATVMVTVMAMVMVTVMAMVMARVKERYCKPLTQDRSHLYDSLHTRQPLMLCLACNIAYTTPTKCYVWRVT